MKYFYYLLLVLIFTACNSNRKGTETPERTDIDSILVTYHCGWINTNVAIKCEKLAVIQALHPANDYSLLSEGIVEGIDTFIVDKPVLKEVESLLEKRKEPEEIYNEDARMYVSIKYKNGTEDNICLNMNIPHVWFNGNPMVIEKRLIYLLRLYSGYYEWFDEDELKSLEEYRDFHNQ